MPTIILRDGDFGTGVTVSVDDRELFLPSRERPGTSEPLPLTAVVEMEAVSDDHSGQLKQAAKLALSGVSTLGPVGLVAGLLAVRKVKDVNFTVRLADGGHFLATTDAVTYAELHAAWQSGRNPAGGANHADDRVDELIAKYVQAREPSPTAPAAPPAAAPATPEGSAAQPAAPSRPTFGRRRA